MDSIKPIYFNENYYYLYYYHRIAKDRFNLNKKPFIIKIDNLKINCSIDIDRLIMVIYFLHPYEINCNGIAIFLPKILDDYKLLPNINFKHYRHKMLGEVKPTENMITESVNIRKLLLCL